MIFYILLCNITYIIICMKCWVNNKRHPKVVETLDGMSDWASGQQSRRCRAPAYIDTVTPVLAFL